MFDSATVSWVLTAVLLGCASFHFREVLRPHHPRDRVNNSLHGLMHVLMAAMLWNIAPSTRLAQIAVLIGAALWFITQAVARADIKMFCATGPGRLNCVYHGVTMAGAALMIVMMGYGATPGHDTVRQDGMLGMHGHHAGTTAAPVSTGATFAASPTLAILLTVFFAVAAGIFMIFLLHRLVSGTVRANVGVPRRLVYAGHSIEALGATVMAVMFATMTG